jgi:amino acid transporter
MAIAFLIATVTTFVPAFLAATRHLSALGEDGYMPRSLARLSWLFTLVSIFLLAVGPQNFLVDITDFMVLISLGIITLSSVWLRAKLGKVGGESLPVLVSASCFVAGGAVYFIDSSVVVFGALAILFAYLIFDALELGPIGLQLFLSVFSLSCLPLLALFDLTTLPHGTFLSALSLSGPLGYSVLLGLLVIAPVLMLTNVYVDARISLPAQRESAKPSQVLSG